MEAALPALRLTRTLVPPADGSPTLPFYLVVIHGTSSGVFHLPRTGMVLIGRGEEADLALEHESVSRRHARIITSDGVARLVDLDSHNGTSLNGEPVTQTVTLSAGDVINVGEFSLVLRSTSPTTSGASVVDAAQLQQRLEHEVARAGSYGRRASVLVALLPQGAPLDPARTAAVANLGRIDLVCPLSDCELRAVLPEAGGDAAASRAAKWASQLGAGVRLGVATFPDDGVDPQILWAEARAAAQTAAEGQVGRASALGQMMAVGDRKVLVADPAMLRLYELLRRLARSDLPVLVTGETGAGKENAAFAVHAWSARSKSRFVTLNCAALTENLLESELFGHEKGAFTGAISAKAGLLELAAGGSVFLDEVGELSPTAQAKLLRAIETRRLVRVGGTIDREVDFRIVAATNRVLEDEVRQGRFRQDLYFRLAAATVVLPPLRDRPREIPLLARAFLDQACERMGRPKLALAPSAMRALCSYPWPGNVRELRNAMEYTAAAALEGPLEAQHLPAKLVAPEAVEAASGAPAQTRMFARLADELRELELRRMREALEAAGGVQTRAAELIGMPVRTFVFKLKRHGLSGRT